MGGRYPNPHYANEGWKDKPLHGKYLIRASDHNVKSSLTHQWLGFVGAEI